MHRPCWRNPKQPPNSPSGLKLDNILRLVKSRRLSGSRTKCWRAGNGRNVQAISHGVNMKTDLHYSCQLHECIALLLSFSNVLSLVITSLSHNTRLTAYKPPKSCAYHSKRVPFGWSMWYGSDTYTFVKIPLKLFKLNIELHCLVESDFYIKFYCLIFCLLNVSLDWRYFWKVKIWEECRIRVTLQTNISIASANINPCNNITPLQTLKLFL